jgi:4-hydroxyproline epimerase
VAGGPDLGDGPLAARLQRLQHDHDFFRRTVVNEPRGSSALVGALLCEPSASDCTAGVIFFNNVGYLGMCGHGLIGLIATLAYLGRIQPGDHRVDTPVGVVTGKLHADGSISVENVPSFRKAKSVQVDVPGIGPIRGDVAWGGNWFFLVEDHNLQLALANLEELTDLTWRIRQAVNSGGFPEVDHIELFAPSERHGIDSKNFVLCPGKEYDRSPCGTGTSAKLACLFADGKLKPGEVWKQESITGSIFEGTLKIDRDQIIPTIKGTAHVTAEVTLVLDPEDPLRHGIEAQNLKAEIRNIKLDSQTR